MLHLAILLTNVTFTTVSACFHKGPLYVSGNMDRQIDVDDAIECEPNANVDGTVPMMLHFSFSFNVRVREVGGDEVREYKCS